MHHYEPPTHGPDDGGTEGCVCENDKWNWMERRKSGRGERARRKESVKTSDCQLTHHSQAHSLAREQYSAQQPHSTRSTMLPSNHRQVKDQPASLWLQDSLKSRTLSFSSVSVHSLWRRRIEETDRRMNVQSWRLVRFGLLGADFDQVYLTVVSSFPLHYHNSILDVGISFKSQRHVLFCERKQRHYFWDYFLPNTNQCVVYRLKYAAVIRVMKNCALRCWNSLPLPLRE